MNLLKALKSPGIFFSSMFFSFFNQYFPSLSEQRNHFYLSQFGGCYKRKTWGIIILLLKTFWSKFSVHIFWCLTPSVLTGTLSAFTCDFLPVPVIVWESFSYCLSEDELHYHSMVVILPMVNSLKDQINSPTVVFLGSGCGQASSPNFFSPPHFLPCIFVTGKC